MQAQDIYVNNILRYESDLRCYPVQFQSCYDTVFFLCFGLKGSILAKGDTMSYIFRTQ
jgi:hypothetical protein